MQAYLSVKDAGVGPKWPYNLYEIVVSGGSNFDTDPTNSVSYKSWHFQLDFETSLRSLRLIVGPQDVSEVMEVKMKKIWGEILKSPIFDLQKHNIPQKKPLKIVIRFWNNIRDFYHKKFEKKLISRFSPQKNCNFSLVSAKFLKNR